jgi:MSHA biogenesis protein MshP
MKRARGFSLVSAIFLMVVLVILGVSLVTMSSVQHTTTAQQLQTVRASHATRMGVEWAVASANTPAGCPAGTTSLTPGGALAGFTVMVTCTRTTHTLAAGPQLFYVVDVAAQSGVYGSPDFVSRRAQTKVLGPAP